MNAHAHPQHQPHVLDNPVWTALTTRQSHLAEISALARRFPADIGPIAGFAAPTRAAYASLAELFAPGEIAAVCLEAPPDDLAPHWQLVECAPMLQMIWTEHPLPPPARDFVALTSADSPEMLALATLTKPGPFATRTHELGDFIGIRSREGQLAAMAGERMRAPGFTEVSAVCTHPEARGRGYARAVMSEVISDILGRGAMPILHAFADNPAIRVYQELGLAHRLYLYLAAHQAE